MITDYLFYLAAIPSVLITGVSKGGFGGVALLAVPLMALVVSPVQAAGIMLPILLVMDIQSLYAYRGAYDKRNLILLLPSAVIGIAIGAFAAQFINDDWIRIIVGTIAIVFALNHWFRASAKNTVKNPSGASGVFLGAFSGFTSFLAHAGAPPFQLYMVPQRLDRKIYAGTSVVFFAAVNFIKIIPYAMLGMLAPANLTTSLVLLPLAPIGVYLGVLANRRLSNEMFYNTIYASIFLVGLVLFWQVLQS
ncbi:MAG: sulfite exporter TauE/SafE family protein [Gammaproteobacteria bacterium]